MAKKVTNIKERVLQLAKNNGVSYEKFCKEIGTSYSNFKGKQKKSALGSDTLEKIMTIYPGTDLYWLVTGKEKNVPLEMAISSLMNKESGSESKNKDASVQDQLSGLHKKVTELEFFMEAMKIKMFLQKERGQIEANLKKKFVKD